MQELHPNRGQETHRALQIGEICDAVAAQADYSDAYTLLYTSRAFFHSAIRYIWGVGQVDARYALTLLPGFSIPAFRNRSFYQTMVDLPRPLPAGYFDRFNIYTPHIRELGHYFPELPVERSSYDNVQFLLDTLGSTVLLPNLVRVVVGTENWAAHETNDPTMLAMFSSPFVTHFTFAESMWFKDRSGFEQLIESVCTRIFPNLQHLSLVTGTDDNTGPHQFNSLPILGHLSSIELSEEILSVELIEWISKLPHLSTLTVARTGPTLERVVRPIKSFQNIRVLVLGRCEMDEIASLWGTSLVSQLTEVKCSIVPRAADTQIGTLFSLMSNYSRQLTKISIARSVMDPRDPYNLCFTPGSIKPGSDFRPRELSLKDARLAGPRPMCTIASLWPSLCKLELADRSIEEDDFLEFPALLPNLEHLTVGVPPMLNEQEQLAKYRLDTMPISPTKSSLTLNTHLHVLGSSQPSQLVIDQLARFFSRWWPTMQLEVPHPKDKSEKVRMKTYEIINQWILELSHGDQAGSSS
ncbi:hypothetical protein FRC08_011689 [Ceratobasidium sp. 394]|nr:hypothetical protein FRC08_011689 [Ceratobasidium sp. 394]